MYTTALHTTAARHHRGVVVLHHNNQPRVLPPAALPRSLQHKYRGTAPRRPRAILEEDGADAVSPLDAMPQHDDAADADAAATQFETSCGVVAPLPAERAEVDYLGESTVGDLHFVNTPKAPPATKPRIDLGDLDKVLATPFKVSACGGGRWGRGHGLEGQGPRTKSSICTVLQ